MAGPALGYGVDRSLSPQEEVKVLRKHNTWTDVRGMTILSLGRALPAHFHQLVHSGRQEHRGSRK